MASRLAGKILAAAVIAAGVAAAAARLRPRPSPAIGTAQWQPLAPNPAPREAGSAVAEQTGAVAAHDPKPDENESTFLVSSDGTCPSSHPVKGNADSGIFHVPGGISYERTKAERCYIDADAAVADGLRQAKR